MPQRDLNEMLNCLFTLVLIYLNRDLEAARHGSCQGTKSLGALALSTLRDYGLVQYAEEGDHLYLTREGAQEAVGALKYLQIALGASLGATREEVRGAWPRLYADEAAAGAGPLTMSEFVAAASEGRRPSHELRPPLSPTALADPPAAYHRDPANGKSLLLHLQLSLGERGSYGGYYGGYYGECYGRRGLGPCWRKVVVPAGLTFLDLHLVIQRCLCWTDQRPFGFLLTANRDNLLIGERDVRGEIPRPQTRKKKFRETRASLLRLADVFPKTHEATYAYGDGTPWEVAVRVLEVRDGVAGLGPQLIDGVGDAPPEWVVGVDGFEAFEDELYRSDRNVIRALSEADKKGFFPFELGVARERLAGFEEDRARWQALLDEQGEKDVAPPASDDDDDLRRFGDYEAYDDFDDPDYPGYDDPDIPL